MDMGRTSVNVLGNCLATVVVARWEGEFDDEKARVFGTPEEVKRELAAENWLWPTQRLNHKSSNDSGAAYSLPGLRKPAAAVRL
jgi:hypothetical protein